MAAPKDGPRLSTMMANLAGTLDDGVLALPAILPNDHPVARCNTIAPADLADHTSIAVSITLRLRRGSSTST